MNRMKIGRRRLKSLSCYGNYRVNRQDGARVCAGLDRHPSSVTAWRKKEAWLAEISSVRAFSTKPHFLDLLGRIQRNMRKV